MCDVEVRGAVVIPTGMSIAGVVSAVRAADALKAVLVGAVAPLAWPRGAKSTFCSGSGFQAPPHFGQHPPTDLQAFIHPLEDHLVVSIRIFLYATQCIDCDEAIAVNSDKVTGEFLLK